MKSLLLATCFLMLFSSCEYLQFSEKITPAQKEQEVNSPDMFLTIKGDVEVDRINCNIQSWAKATTYDNIAVTIHYFTATRELIKSEQRILETKVTPGVMVNHTISILPPPVNFGLLYISVREAEAFEAAQE